MLFDMVFDQYYLLLFPKKFSQKFILFRNPLFFFSSPFLSLSLSLSFSYSYSSFSFFFFFLFNYFLCKNSTK